MRKRKKTGKPAAQAQVAVSPEPSVPDASAPSIHPEPAVEIAAPPVPAKAAVKQKLVFDTGKIGLYWRETADKGEEYFVVLKEPYAGKTRRVFITREEAPTLGQDLKDAFDRIGADG